MTDKENKDGKSNDDADNREEIITKIIGENPAEFILQELKEAYERQWNLKDSHEKKATSIVTIAGILTSLLFGFAGYLHTNNLQLVSTNAIVPSVVVILFIITGIVANSAAVVFSILGLRMTKYGFIYANVDREYIRKEVKKPKLVVMYDLMSRYHSTIEHNIRSNNSKLRLVRIAQWCLFVGIFTLPALIFISQFVVHQPSPH